MTPSLLGVIPYAAINLGVYDGLRATYLKSVDSQVSLGALALASREHLRSSPCAHRSSHSARMSVGGVDAQDGKVPKGVALVCGALSGVIGATCTFPLEVVRRRMMVGGAYNNTAHALFTISQQEGVSALFKGCLLGWVKLAPSAGLSFYCYESAKEVLEL